MTRLAYAVVLAACAGAYLASLGALQVGQHTDDAVYVSVGKSLRSGLGYVRFEDPTHPVETQYPPALPALIALVLQASGDNLEALRLIPLLFSLAALPLAYAFFRARLPVPRQEGGAETWALLLLALFGLNHLIVGYAGMVMNEAPFMCLLLAALVWVDRGREAPLGARWIVVMALILAAATLFRSAGLAVALGIALWLWRQGQGRQALAMLLLTGLLILPWMAAQAAWTGAWLGAGYRADIPSAGDTTWPLLLRPVENLALYATQLVPQTLFPFFGTQVEAAWSRLGLDFAPHALGLLVTLGVTAGAALYARRRSDAATWVFVIMTLLLLCWPYRYTRFFLPLMPIALLYLLTLGHALLKRRRGWLIAFAAVTLLGFVGRDALLVARPPRHAYPDLHALGRLMETHTPPGATILAFSPSGMALYADRGFMDAVPPKGTAPLGPALLEEMLARSAPYPPRFFLAWLDSPAEHDVETQLVRRGTGRLIVRSFEPWARLYQVARQEPPADD